MYLQSNTISHTNTGQHKKKKTLIPQNNKNKIKIEFSEESVQKMKCNNENVNNIEDLTSKRGRRVYIC